MYPRISIIALFGVLFSVTVSLGQNKYEEIPRNFEWTTFDTYDGIKIEYKFTEVNNEVHRNKVLVLLRLTNTTDQRKSVSWVNKIWMNGVCRNCHELDSPEHINKLNLEPQEVVEGQPDARLKKGLLIFSNWTKLSPGMTDSRLTNLVIDDVVVEEL